MARPIEIRLQTAAHHRESHALATPPFTKANNRWRGVDAT
jgi:hypothetical protein